MSTSTSASQGIVGLTLAPGDRVQHYNIVQLIGAGGTSAVFKAHDVLLNRHVAVKQVLLAPGEEADAYRARVLAEADAHKKAAAADPAMLVQLLDVVADPRGVLIITEFVDGPSLEQILQANPAPMEERQALGILAGAAKGLASLHATGILHRDVKPANILMPRAGGLRLADFGLSVAASSGQPMDQGTVRYMAPEILQDQAATPGSDLYALGMVAYEMLAGRAQFEEAFKAILRDQRNQAMRWLKWHTNPKIRPTPLAQLNPSLSPRIVELVERLMDKDPVRRISSATDLLNAIRTLVATPAAPATTEGLPPPWLAQQGPVVPAVGAAATSRVPRRRKWPLVVAGVGVAAALALIAAKIAMDRAKPDPNAIERARVIALMNQGEDAWKARNFDRALEIFGSMQQGGKEERKENTTSRRFADAGAAKCRAEIAFANRNYDVAVTAAEEFKKLAAALEADPAYPPEGLRVTKAEESELAEKMLKPTEKFMVRKDVADAIAHMQDLLEQGKTKDCAGACNQWLAMPKLEPEETAKIRKILAECSMTRKERLRERLLTDAKKLAAAGDVQGATRMLSDEIKIAGDAADPRLRELLDTILGTARIDQIKAKYRAAETTEEKISLLNAILTLDPAFEDKDKLPTLRADLCYAQAQDAFKAGQLDKAQEQIVQGLELAPGHADLLGLRRIIAFQLEQAKLVADADALFDQGQFAEAADAYKLVVDKVENQEAKDRAATRIKEARGQLKIAEAARLIKSGELVKAEIALKTAQEYLPENADIAAGFERIKELREAQGLLEDAARAFNRGDHSAAIPLYFKLVNFLKAHPTTGNLGSAEERLRQCRFENAMAMLGDAIAHHQWTSARGAVGIAETYAVRPEEKKRLKETKEHLDAASAADQ